MARPTRLDRISYTGPHAYFVTSCTLERRKAFADNEFCEECRAELTAMSTRFGFTTTAYCFMPDHVHLLTGGDRADASLPSFISTWKQRTGFAWHKRSGARLWQKGYYEHVVRADEEHLSIARYIFENPVRAGLVNDARQYRWLGSDRFSVEEILSALDALRPWLRPPIKGGPTGDGG